MSPAELNKACKFLAQFGERVLLAQAACDKGFITEDELETLKREFIQHKETVEAEIAKKEKQ